MKATVPLSARFEENVEGTVSIPNDADVGCKN